ncbi:Scr1 family TA system antitoxin-like transcriptional regulator [Streptomyces sp. NBC_01310]|uniref:Scr1 family TA system antitoxin-like transcriptional regulator n=1 Tax=Streptomyces sp. NBC_01310 TaxID=2903820 RepID=UPI0035B5A89F
MPDTAPRPIQLPWPWQSACQERFTSDLYLEKRSDVRRYSDMYAHMQARALSPDMTRNFIEEAGKAYAGTELRADA